MERHRAASRASVVAAFACALRNLCCFLPGASPSNQDFRPDWARQKQRDRGRCRHVYALRAGRICPSCALLPPTPRLIAAFHRLRGLSRVFFHRAAQGRLGHAAGAHSIFVGARIPAGRVFAKLFLAHANLVIRQARRPAVQAANRARTPSAIVFNRSAVEWPISMKAWVASDQ